MLIRGLAQRPPLMFAAVLVAVLTACGGEPTSVTTVSSAPTQAETVGLPTNVEGPFPVARVVDGDTVRVVIEGQEFPVRLIGIDTPETVDPNRPVECAGPEASVYAEQLMNGQMVYLELDPSQGVTDKYDRLLAYVWLPSGVMVNLLMVEAGLADEYTYAAPYRYQQEFRAAQEIAQSQLVGKWGEICY